MVIGRGHEGTAQGSARRRLTKVASLALGIAMFGTVGLSGALAQDEDVSVGIADAEAIVNSILEEVFAEIFGGDVAADDAASSGGGNINTGGSGGGPRPAGGGGGVLLGGGGGGGGATGGGGFG